MDDTKLEEEFSKGYTSALMAHFNSCRVHSNDMPLVRAAFDAGIGHMLDQECSTKMLDYLRRRRAERNARRDSATADAGGE